MAFNFACADTVGEGRHIAVMHVVGKENSKPTVKRKGNIARPKKAKRPIGKMKTAEGMDNINQNEKTWMMQLQHPGHHGLKRCLTGLQIFSGISISNHFAIFAVPMVGL